MRDGSVSRHRLGGHRAREHRRRGGPSGCPRQPSRMSTQTPTDATPRRRAVPSRNTDTSRRRNWMRHEFVDESTHTAYGHLATTITGSRCARVRPLSVARELARGGRVARLLSRGASDERRGARMSCTTHPRLVTAQWPVTRTGWGGRTKAGDGRSGEFSRLAACTTTPPNPAAIATCVRNRTWTPKNPVRTRRHTPIH